MELLYFGLIAAAVLVAVIIVIVISTVSDRKKEEREEKSKTEVQVKKIYVTQSEDKEEVFAEELIKVDRLSELPSAEKAKALRDAKNAELKQAAFRRGKKDLLDQLSQAINNGRNGLEVTTPSYRVDHNSGYCSFAFNHYGTIKYMISSNLIEELKKKGIELLSMKYLPDSRTTL